MTVVERVVSPARLSTKRVDFRFAPERGRAVFSRRFSPRPIVFFKNRQLYFVVSGIFRLGNS